MRHYRLAQCLLAPPAHSSPNSAEGAVSSSLFLVQLPSLSSVMVLSSANASLQYMDLSSVCVAHGSTLLPSKFHALEGQAQTSHLVLCPMEAEHFNIPSGEAAPQ